MLSRNELPFPPGNPNEILDRDQVLNALRWYHLRYEGLHKISGGFVNITCLKWRINDDEVHYKVMSGIQSDCQNTREVEECHMKKDVLYVKLLNK